MIEAELPKIKDAHCYCSICKDIRKREAEMLAALDTK